MTSVSVIVMTGLILLTPLGDAAREVRSCCKGPLVIRSTSHLCYLFLGGEVSLGVLEDNWRDPLTPPVTSGYVILVKGEAWGSFRVVDVK